MPLDFTDEDLLILEKQRIERFRSLFAEPLARCFIHLNKQNILTIHCTEPYLVDHFLHEIEQICCYAKVVVGADRVSICFAQEEIYATSTQPFNKQHSKTRCDRSEFSNESNKAA